MSTYILNIDSLYIQDIVDDRFHVIFEEFSGRQFVLKIIKDELNYLVMRWYKQIRQYNIPKGIYTPNQLKKIYKDTRINTTVQHYVLSIQIFPLTEFVVDYLYLSQ